MRSLPRTSSIVKKSVGDSVIGVPKVAPLSVERAKPTLFRFPPGNLRHAMYALGEPLPAKRGIDAWPSCASPETTLAGLHVGVGERMSSEYVVLICTPALPAGEKLVQL